MHVVTRVQSWHVALDVRQGFYGIPEHWEKFVYEKRQFIVFLFTWVNLSD